MHLSLAITYQNGKNDVKCHLIVKAHMENGFSPRRGLVQSVGSGSKENKDTVMLHASSASMNYAGYA